MFVILGLAIVFASIIAGYTLHGGQLLVLFQISEFLIIGGSALGALLIANPPDLLRRIVRGVIVTVRGNRLTKAAYLELLQFLYELLQLAKREGLIALEQHVENPENSTIFAKYPTVLANQHAVAFFCDTMKVVLNGGIPPHDLEDLMDLDLETIHHKETRAPAALITVADALPGLGIVAAVLGVVITMGKVDQPPEVVGHSIAAALVGTFLGVLLSYGVVGPIGRSLENHTHAEHRYLNCIKATILAFVKGAPPVVAVEYGRRAIDPDFRPSFQETEDAVKRTR
ncbi:MAG: flagellar motor stator protein MotA [Candidatus Kapabacteria bacterium]|nr:flagellar motor stator protein MotA [Candidatus Kapabacteria bacterium]MCS7169838.1 flagellar motor stator protein MotA [Candidatus Kapabacteria bacterium]MDW8225234.1 flagellar motor stator protein MotA [Bacteroidota bacterium]